jgi:uncharacterized coiled-coil DUF342 family protein
MNLRLRGKSLTLHENTNEIETLDQKIDTLREQLRKINVESKSYALKRDTLNDQFKMYRSQILELKDQRNNLNDKVKSLKLQRDEARSRIAGLIMEIKIQRTKIDELKKKKPKKSQQLLQKEFQEIEWTVQTTSLDLEEEKHLMNIIKEIEPQLAIYRKIEKKIGEIAEHRKSIQTLNVRAVADHRELTSVAEKSQELHGTLVARIEESKAVKSEADKLHTAYVETREKAKSLYEELKRVTEQKRNLENNLRVQDQNKRITFEKTLKENLGNQARQKLQKGEKISWQEFQLLESDDEGPDSETQN